MPASRMIFQPSTGSFKEKFSNIYAYLFIYWLSELWRHLIIFQVSLPVNNVLNSELAFYLLWLGVRAKLHVIHQATGYRISTFQLGQTVEEVWNTFLYVMLGHGISGKSQFATCWPRLRVSIYSLETPNSHCWNHFTMFPASNSQFLSTGQTAHRSKFPERHYKFNDFVPMLLVHGNSPRILTSIYNFTH